MHPVESVHSFRIQEGRAVKKNRSSFSKKVDDIVCKTLYTRMRKTEQAPNVCLNKTMLVVEGSNFNCARPGGIRRDSWPCPFVEIQLEKRGHAER